MTRHAHVAGPHRHTQEPTWHDVTSGLADDGPRLEYWGVLGPFGRYRSLKSFSLL